MCFLSQIFIPTTALSNQGIIKPPQTSKSIGFFQTELSNTFQSGYIPV
jgi:hypothetical protein